MKKTKFANYRFRIIVLIFILLFCCSVTVKNNTQQMIPNNFLEEQKEHNETPKYDNKLYVLSVRNRVKCELITEVNNFIKTETPESKISPQILVEKCLKYNIDIVFVLSQGYLESHLGTKGSAVKTNSVWNVGTFDCGKRLYTYKHANQSIEPYLKLLKERYLLSINHKGDTLERDIYSLIKDKGFYNVKGYRFAAKKDYENSIRKLMIMINNKTSISMYQSLLEMNDEQMAKMFAPNNNEKQI